MDKVIYINDLPDSAKSNVYLFDDDAKIYKSINSLNDHDILQHDIHNLTKWSLDWLMTINPDKLKVLKVGRTLLSIMTMSCRIIPCSLHTSRKTWELFSIRGCPLIHILMQSQQSK